MRNIIIVDAVSTGYNYVEDIIRRGYSPVVLEPRKEDLGLPGNPYANIDAMTKKDGMGCVKAVCGTRPADISYSITQAAAIRVMHK